MLSEKRVSSAVVRNSCSIITSGSMFRVFGTNTTRMSSADSSRMSSKNGSFLSTTMSAISLISLPLAT